MTTAKVRSNQRRGSLTGVTASVLLIVAATSVDLARADEPIRVSTTQAEPLSGYQSSRVYAGRTVAARSSRLGFNRGGALAEVLVDIGDVVADGDVLARLDTAALAASEAQALADVALGDANLEAARAEAQLARNTERRVRKLHQDGHASKQELDEVVLNGKSRYAAVRVAQAQRARAAAALRSIRVALDESVIKAPYAGVVQSRSADEGAQMAPGQTLIKLVEHGVVEAHVGVPTSVAADLEPATRYTVQWDGTLLAGELRSVLPEVDASTRTVTAVLKLDGTERMPLGEVVELVVKRAVPEPGYWLPVSALTESDRGLWGVYVVNPERRVERRLVEILHTESDRAYVRGTLVAGDAVVQSGVHRIVPGQLVEADFPGSATVGGR